MFGNPETTPGGRALKFYASVRLDIRRIETIKSGTDSIGSRVRVKVVKNKVAAPFRVAEFDVMYGEGISQEGGLLDVGVASDVVTKTGAWFTYGERGSARAASRPRSSSRRTRTSPPRSRRRSAPRSTSRRSPSRASKRPSSAAVAAGGRRSRRSREPSPSGGRRGPRSTMPGGRGYAARLLEARSRSVAEVRRKLTRQGYRTALVDDAVDSAPGARVSSTTRCSRRAWVESRDRARPRGEHALRRELALKGVDRGVIDGVLAARRGEVDEPDDPSVAPVEGDPDRAAAERLLERRRAALLREPDPRKRRARAYALLARNGFAPDVASELSRRVDEAVEDDTSVE